MSSRFCKVCSGWHSLDEDWPSACAGHFHGRSSGPQIIRDIQPYQAVAVDVATGKPPKIGSRSEHREFLKRNNYIEIGNEKTKPRPIDTSGEVTAREIHHTIERLKESRR